MPEGLYLLNPPAKGRRHTTRAKTRTTGRHAMTNKKRRKSRSRRRNPVAALAAANPRRRRSYRRKRNPGNPMVKRHYRAKARRRRNPTAVLYGVANPKKRRHYRRGSGGGGGARGMFGDLQKLMRPEFLMQTLGAGVGLLAAIVVPNWLLNNQTWYQGWTKVLVRAGTALVAFPLFTRMLPGAIGVGFASGAAAAVGVSALAELLGRPLIIGPGSTDIAATPQTLFAGLGTYTTKMLRGTSPLGAAIAKGMIRSPFSGVAGDLGMAAHNALIPSLPGGNLVAALYDKGTGF